MNLMDVLCSQAWAMDPGVFDQMCAVLERHMEGERFTAEQIQAAIGRAPGTPNPKSRKYEVHQGVALIPVQGVLSKYASEVGDLCYGRGNAAETIADDIATALADPSVTAMLLHVESPGGVVDGTFGVADRVRAAAMQKPCWAFIDGMGASAAYAIACGASQVWASPTSIVGSIGVIKAIRDTSEANAKAGVKTVVIRSGPLKGGVVPGEPVTDDNLAPDRSIVQAMASQFRGLVQDARGLADDDMDGDDGIMSGRAWIAREAIDRGLCDAVGSYEQCLAALTDPNKRQVRRAKPSAPVRTIPSSPPPVLTGRAKAQAAPIESSTAQTGATTPPPPASGRQPEGPTAMQIDPARLNDLIAKHSANQAMVTMIMAMATGAGGKAPASEADILAAITAKENETTKSQLEDMKVQLREAQGLLAASKDAHAKALGEKDTEIAGLRAQVAERDAKIAASTRGVRPLEGRPTPDPKTQAANGDEPADFNAAVEKFRKAGHPKPHSEAVAKYPELHRAFLQAANPHAVIVGGDA